MLKGIGDSERVAWQAYYIVNDVKAVYDSRKHVWDDLPTQGVQVLLVDYGNERVQRHTSINFYAVSSADVEAAKQLLPSTFKFSGARYDNDLWQAAWSEYKRITTDEDNSVVKYEDTKKRLDGWTAIYGVGSTVTVYTSATTAWADLPQTGLLIQLRHYKSGKTAWTERHNNDLLYTETRAEEGTIDLYTNKIKLGGMADIVKLQEQMDDATTVRSI